MQGVQLAKVESSEKSAAAAIHIGAVFAPLWIPIAAYLLSKDKRGFVASHAKQSLLETIVLNVLIGIAMLGSLAYTIWKVYTLVQGGVEKIDWNSVLWQSALRLGAWWLAMGILWVINLIVSIRQAMAALRGEWPKSVQRRAAR